MENYLSVPKDRIVPRRADGKLEIAIDNVPDFQTDHSIHCSRCAVDVLSWQPVEFGPNPRPTDTKTSIAKTIVKGLMNQDGEGRNTFIKKNRGITLIVDDVIYDHSTKKLILIFDPKIFMPDNVHRHGVLDGATTQWAIIDNQETIRVLNGVNGFDFIKQQVQLEIYQASLLSDEEIFALAKSRQISRPHEASSFANMEGKFRPIQHAIKDAPWSSKVIYNQARKTSDKNIDIHFLLMIVALMDVKKRPFLDDNTVARIENTKTHVNAYVSDPKPFLPYLSLLPDFALLWDTLTEESPRLFNKAKNKTKNTASDAPRLFMSITNNRFGREQRSTLMFEDKPKSPLCLTLNAQRALFSCFRKFLILGENGQYEWLLPFDDILDFLHSKIGQVLRQCNEAFDGLSLEDVRRNASFFATMEQKFHKAYGEWENNRVVYEETVFYIAYLADRGEYKFGVTHDPELRLRQLRNEYQSPKASYLVQLKGCGYTLEAWVKKVLHIRGECIPLTEKNMAIVNLLTACTDMGELKVASAIEDFGKNWKSHASVSVNDLGGEYADDSDKNEDGGDDSGDAISNCEPILVEV
jgi:hypothetical protein